MKILLLIAALLMPAHAFASVTCTGDAQWLSSATLPVTVTPFTISLWVKRATAASAFEDTAIAISNNNANDFFTVMIHSSDADRMSAWHRQGGGTTGRANQGADSLGDGTWHHVTARFDSDSLRRIKVDDGTETSNADVKTAITVSVLTVCRRDDGTPANYWDGQLAEVAIWDVALTDPQVTGLAGGDNPLAVDATNLIAYWPLLTNANDAKGSNNLTNNGTATFSAGDHPTIDAAPGGARRRARPRVLP